MALTMARRDRSRNNRRKRSIFSTQRNLLPITSRRLLSPKLVFKPPSPRLFEVEDRRRVPEQPPKLVNARPAKIRPFVSPFGLVKFRLPKRAIICVRRKLRREVLFAKGGAGKGKRRFRRKHFNDDSNFHC